MGLAIRYIFSKTRPVAVAISIPLVPGVARTVMRTVEVFNGATPPINAKPPRKHVYVHGVCIDAVCAWEYSL